MDLTSKRTKSDGDPSDPEIDPATRRELEDRMAELSKENAVLEKVILTLPCCFYLNSHGTRLRSSLRL
jgi:hypothetical protein